jgi:hypothetical protein
MYISASCPNIEKAAFVTFQIDSNDWNIFINYETMWIFINLASIFDCLNSNSIFINDFSIILIQDKVRLNQLAFLLFFIFRVFQIFPEMPVFWIWIKIALFFEITSNHNVCPTLSDWKVLFDCYGEFPNNSTVSISLFYIFLCQMAPTYGFSHQFEDFKTQFQLWLHFAVAKHLNLWINWHSERNFFCIC